MEQQLQGQRVSLPLRSPSLGLSEVQSVLTGQAALGFMLFPNESFKKNNLLANWFVWMAVQGEQFLQLLPAQLVLQGLRILETTWRR